MFGESPYTDAVCRHGFPVDPDEPCPDPLPVMPRIAKPAPIGTPAIQWETRPATPIAAPGQPGGLTRFDPVADRNDGYRFGDLERFGL